MKTYRGRRAAGVPMVFVAESSDDPDGEVLLDPGPSRAVCDHSPDGFEWGYSGSGPAQLALALLLDATGDRRVSESLYQTFKRQVVAGWHSAWSITAAEVNAWVDSKRGPAARPADPDAE